MRLIGIILSAAILGAGAAQAAVLQDWAKVEPKKNVGTFTDENGSRLDLSSAPGPQAGEKALEIKASIIQWGGAWAAVEADLSRDKALKFKAKASEPCLLQVGLTDEAKTQWVAQVRVVSNAWEEFTVPFSRFEKTKYPVKDAPKDGMIKWSKISGLQFQPNSQGKVTLDVGPVSSSAAGAARTGLPDPKGPKVVAQDFALLGKNACGPYADKESGTAIQMTVEKDPADPDRRVGVFKYDLKNCGWCGYWMRSGDFWGGQDWRGAQSLSLEVYTEAPTAIFVSFNDANQNSYSAVAPKTKGGAWETVSIPFSKFKLDEYYQPPEAKEGAPQDLSKIETFNIAPKTPGAHTFKVREVAVHKK